MEATGFPDGSDVEYDGLEEEGKMILRFSFRRNYRIARLPLIEMWRASSDGVEIRSVVFDVLNFKTSCNLLCSERTYVKEITQIKTVYSYVKDKNGSFLEKK